MKSGKIRDSKLVELWEYGVACLYGPLYASFVCRVGVALSLGGKGCLKGVFRLSLKAQETSGFHTLCVTWGDTGRYMGRYTGPYTG